MRLEEVLKLKDKRFYKESKFSNAKDSKKSKMDSRYWKEFENMDDMETDKRSESGSDRVSPRYRKETSDRRRRSKTRSRSRSRSHSRSHSHSSSSSSSSSSRSSSSSSRHHSDYRSRRSTSKSKRDTAYPRKSPSRTGSSYSSKRDEERNGSSWFPPSHPSYSNQGQDIPSSTSYIPPQYPSTVQGSYPANFQGQQNFGSSYHGYPGYESTGNYYPPNPQNFPHAAQPSISEYNIGAPTNHPPTTNWEIFPDTTQPPPILGGPGPATGPISGDSHPGLPDIKAEEAKKEAIEQELLQQKRTLAKQREDYVKRKFSLNRELNRLKDQKRELLKENSKENERILRENAKLQNEILQKLKSIDNVIEMLSNIIGDSAHLPEVIKEIKSSEKSEKKKSDKKKRDKSEERRSSESAEEEQHRERDRARERDHEERDESRQKDENRVYYDPGLHWCPECNIFPKTVSEYLDHLHSSQHKQNTKLKSEDYPWHMGQNLEEKTPLLANKDCPPKRIPIRGVQFLIPATAWFCSMCKVWLGDIHCATKHIQSNSHSTNYNEFIMKNQHWEVDWLTERTRSYERNSEAKQQQTGVLVPQQVQPPPAPLTIATLSDQLLAMIAANSKLQEPPPPPPPPPPPITKSSSSSEDDSPSRKSKKKKKKSKKSKKSKDKSPSKELDLIKLNYKAMTEKKAPELVPHDDSFISEWMPKVEKRDAVPIKPKPKNDIPEVRPLKRSRRLSAGSQESSGNPSERFVSPDDNLYDDHDDAVIFDKKPTAISASSNYEKNQSSRSKKREEEITRHERHSKYERSPKEKSKYEERFNKYNKFDKYKQMEKEEKESRYEDYKSKKEIKPYVSDRDKHKKSPVSRLRDIKEKETERKRGRGKLLDKNDDDDAHETSFEKRTSESAAKKKDGKKVAPNNLPKTKLPFIGRMPILKKKVEQKSEEKEEKKDIEDSASKDSLPELALLQEPVVEALPTEMAPPVEELPKSTLIISKRPRLAEPGIVKKEILFNKPANDNLTEQDMELDDDSTVVPKEEEPAKDELHKDFKDALDLLFPEEKKADSNEEVEVKEETEAKIEEQQAIVASAAPTTYMLPAGYDMSMYQTYYDHAYVQQWAQMGYDQTGQYASAYAYPPPTMEGVQQAAMEVVVQPTETPVVDVAVPEIFPKKKKNPLSQRMRRHLQKKKAKEAAEKAKEEGGEAESESGNMEYDIDEEDGDDFEEEQEQETENDKGLREEHQGEGYSKLGDMSDLALLGIDEDDAAAQGFY
ncbi:zinc finger matrin-type protein CG9776 isoform X2 [Halyomorpha halys]|uniref:zinc finger matrin-type protein CG9776 isoform X2 n=1 Tax=Halyomorpha halys TaxID=286706 RepID=UPI0006D4C729|nr:zinc finger matrin-type protein CG9776-like isoform X2 [Halyomorpha halys]